VAVAVDEAREYRRAFGIRHPVGRWRITERADPRDYAVFDKHGSIGQDAQPSDPSALRDAPCW
jgi:hypothetical protein